MGYQTVARGDAGAVRAGASARIGGTRVFERLADACLAAYILTIYIWADGEETVRYSTLLCLASMVFMLLALLPRHALIVTPPVACMFLFVGFCIASVLWARDPGRSLTMALRTLPLLAIFGFTLYNYAIWLKKVPLLFNLVYAAGVVLAVYTIFIEGGLGAYVQLLFDGVRAGAEVNNVNTIGLAAGTSALIAFGCVYRRRKWVHLLPFALCVFVALGTGSNKAVVLIVTGCVLILMLSAYQNGTLWAFLKVAFAVAALALVVWFLLQLPIFTTISHRIEGTVNAFLGQGRIDGSASVRIELSAAGMEQFAKTPLLGIGINNGALVASDAVGHDYYLHNNYVELLAGVGIVGTVLFYAMLLLPMVKIAREMKKDAWVTVVVVAVLLGWLFIQVGVVCYYSKMTYVYFALAAAMAYGAPCAERV